MPVVAAYTIARIGIILITEWRNWSANELAIEIVSLCTGFANSIKELAAIRIRHLQNAFSETIELII